MRKPAFPLFAVLFASSAWLALAPAALAAPVHLGQTGGGQTCDVDSYYFQDAVASGTGYVVPAGDWALTSWSTQGPAGAGEQAAIVVARPLGGGSYRYVVVGPVEALTAGVLNTFSVSARVQGGDILGLWGTSGAICAAFTADVGDVFHGDIAPGNVGPPAQGGTDTSAELGTGAAFRLNVSANLATTRGPRTLVCTTDPHARGDGTTGSFFDLSSAAWAAGVSDASSFLYQSTPAIYVEALGTMSRLSDVVTYGGSPDSYRDAGFEVNESGDPTPPNVSPGDWGAVYEYYARK